MLKKPKVPYYTEEQYCDAAWSGHKDFEPFSGGWTESILFREKEIAYGLRPDFIQYGMLNQHPTVFIYEFKVFASFHAIDQVQRYRRVMHQHVFEYVCANHERGYVMPEIKTAVLATGFDSFVYETADSSGVYLWRLTMDGGVCTANFEGNPYCPFAGAGSLDSEYAKAVGCPELIKLISLNYSFKKEGKFNGQALY